jgi:hypothetical protein
MSCRAAGLLALNSYTTITTPTSYEMLTLLLRMMPHVTGLLASLV